MIITGRVKYEIMNEWTKEQTIKKPHWHFHLFAYSFFRFTSKTKLILKYRMFMQKKTLILSPHETAL